MLHSEMAHVMLLQDAKHYLHGFARLQLNTSSILEDGSHSPKAVNFFSDSKAKSVFVLYV